MQRRRLMHSFFAGILTSMAPVRCTRGRGAKPAEPARTPRPIRRAWCGCRPITTSGSTRRTRRVVMVGQVCLREGQMEMFACLKNTKEHESVLAVPTEAFVVHAALMAVGAEPGNPARFRPKYQPARGRKSASSFTGATKKGSAVSRRLRIGCAICGPTSRSISLGSSPAARSGSTTRPSSGITRRKKGFHLRLELLQRHARLADREQPGQQFAAVRGHDRPHPTQRDERHDRAHAQAQRPRRSRRRSEGRQVCPKAPTDPEAKP